MTNNESDKPKTGHIKEKGNRPKPYSKPSATVSGLLLTTLQTIFSSLTTASRPFRGAVAARRLNAMYVSNAGFLDSGKETAQNSTNQQQQVPVHQSSQIKDKYFDISDDILPHCQMTVLLEHANYFDKVDFSKIAKGVKSRLSKSIYFWEHIGASKFILNTLKHGYVIPFTCTPPPMKFKNYKSAIENNVFVDEAVSELINNGCIQEVPFQPFVVNPLSVAIQKSGEKRIILDLSELNVYVAKNKIKFEDWKVALQFFERDCYMFKFDLTSGYFHLDICIEQQTYLGFSWNNTFYCFSVLAFGLTSAPYIFTKCLRPMVKYWRENGVNIVLYLDDGFDLAEGYLECKNKSDFVKLSLKQAGILVNEGKYIFEPVQSLEWLGLIWNSKAFSLKIPERRISDTIESLEKLLKLFPYISALTIITICR